MRTQTFNPIKEATIDLLMRNSTIQVLKHAYFKHDVPTPADHHAWYMDKETKKAMSQMISIALNTAKKKKKLIN